MTLQYFVDPYTLLLRIRELQAFMWLCSSASVESLPTKDNSTLDSTMYNTIAMVTLLIVA